MSFAKPSLVQQGIHYQEQGEYEEARHCYERALEENSKNLAALVNLGVILHRMNKTKEGLKYIDKALKIHPHHPDVLYNKAELLRQHGDFYHALIHYEQVSKLQKPTAMHLFHVGCCYEGMGNYKSALHYYKEAFELKQEAKIAAQAGHVFSVIHQLDMARASYENSLKCNPHYGRAYAELAAIERFSDLKKSKELYEKALACDPQDPKALAGLWIVKLFLCDWSNYQEIKEQLHGEIQKNIAEGKYHLINVFDSIVLELGPSLWSQWIKGTAQSIERQATYQRKSYTFSKRPPLPRKLKIGYASTDFNDHPVAHLAKNLFLYHDKSQFEIHAYSFGVDDGSEYRRHMEATADYFTDCSQWTDGDCADKICKDGIDILIDLNGHTAGNHLGVFALKPAPIQVTYLGFPGSLQLSCIDYVLGDDTIIPDEHLPYYSEHRVALPEVYIITDDEQKIGIPFPKAMYGLPEEALVLCSFNAPYKLNPLVFECWMRILHECPQTVLWLYVSHESTKENLRQRAREAGIDATRLIFAERVKDKGEHLARLSVADLFLDAFVVNGHTTCVDALWSGVPVVTCTGNIFPQRAATSLLKAIGLPELITNTPKEYEEKVLHLIKHPEALLQVKEKLKKNRLTMPLFKTHRLVQHFERAYMMMWERREKGLPPEAFKVPAIS